MPLPCLSVRPKCHLAAFVILHTIGWVNASPPTKTTNKIFSSTHVCRSNGRIAAMIQIAAQIAINATTSLFDWFN
jgi:hypothetical protein